MRSQLLAFSFFFFNDTATTEIYTLSLHDALPISTVVHVLQRCPHSTSADGCQEVPQLHRRKLPETLLDLPLRGLEKDPRGHAAPLPAHEVQPPAHGDDLAIGLGLEEHLPALVAALQLAHVLGALLTREWGAHFR